MKRTVAILFLLLSIVVGVRAETVTRKEASQLAQTFFNEANGRVVAPVKMVYNGRHLTTARLFIPFYVFNEPAGGFVIISAENKAFPILGYSLRENFNPDRMGEVEKALLTSYARDIELIRYDSSEPTEAIAAWQNYPQYVKELLDSPYNATDPRITPQEARERLDYVVDSGLAEETASDIFTPSQWEGLIMDELKSTGSVALGIVDKGKVYPAIVHGHKGDYYRLELDRRNDWLMRLLPTELLSGLQIADFSNPTRIPLPEPEDDTYRFYDDFRAEVAKAEESVTPLPEEELTLIGEPEIEGIGGGHYAITLPEEVRLMTVYNLSGAIVQMRTFKQTNTAFADLSDTPYGFYFALLHGASGRTYGVKLTR